MLREPFLHHPAFVDAARTVHGRPVVEHRGVSDDLAMMTQLGVIPEMG